MGGHVAIQAAAASTAVAGLTLVNSAGLEPTTTQRPFWLSQFIGWLLVASPLSRAVAAAFTRFVCVSMLGFPKRMPTAAFATAQRCTATQNFAAIRASAHVVRQKGLPTFMAYATNVRVITTAMSEALAAKLEPRATLVLADGGHYLHKTKPDERAHALVDWVHRSST
ncbi:Aste57867_21772 [Aphanomyces stellatus]|uniref:Aste57867_21772 protein n=1 Tax=Aphanomyces stellatus TaxID=120398 RepID=A0A485LKH3_9STRA|nr:hypothetical protein As57867_021703 [Aphanomyces stellatus]VFT98441.1 Aste57867_21772 [Aphanomyces stellatus]